MCKQFVRGTLKDSGVGMPPDILAHAIEPFFIIKDVGIGMGLSQVYGFVQQAAATW